MRLPLASGPEAVADALAWIERRTAGLAADTHDRIVLAAGEALANAVEHGGGRVWIDLQTSPRGATLTVGDGGAGPSPEALTGATLPADPAQTDGRGLFLMRMLADRVTVRDGALVLTFADRPPALRPAE